MKFLLPILGKLTAKEVITWKGSNY